MRFVLTTKLTRTKSKYTQKTLIKQIDPIKNKVAF